MRTVTEWIGCSSAEIAIPIGVTKSGPLGNRSVLFKCSIASTSRMATRFLGSFN